MARSPRMPSRVRSSGPKRRLLRGALVLTTLVGAGVAGWLQLPAWIEGVLVERVKRALAAEVRVDAVRLGLSSMRLEGVTISREAAALELDTVDLSWAWEIGARPWVHAPVLDVPGGALRGTLGGVRGWVESVRDARGAASEDTDGPSSSAAGGLGSWVALDDVAYAVEGLRVDVSAAESVGMQHVAVTVAVRGDRSVASVRATDWALTPVSDRGLSLGAVETTVPLGEPLFPRVLQISGGAARLASTVFAENIAGALTIEDPAAIRVGAELTGTLAPRGEGAPTSEDGLGSGVPWRLTGGGRRDLSEGEWGLELSRFELGRAPRLLARLPLVRSEDATVGGALSVTASGDAVRIEGEVALEKLNVDHPLLGPEVVEDVGFSASLRATTDRRLEAFAIEALTLRRDAVSVEVRGDLRWPREVSERAVQLSVDLPKTGCQEVLNAIPRQLVPGLRRLRLNGSMRASAHLKADMRDLEALDLKADVDVRRCRIERMPTPVGRVEDAFKHKILMRDGRVRSLDLSPNSRDFTPLASISPAMVGAVLTTEDAAFFKHDGFLKGQIEAALRRNLKARRVELGASTISMQLAKNLLLSHERTISRKLQELVLTWVLERTLTKERMMELYLNIVEFGPAVYGVSAAADHFFGKVPGELNSLEAAWLALMLPDPVGRYEHFCAGTPSPAFETKLRRIHRLMWSRGHIDELEYTLWKDGMLVFSGEHRVDPQACRVRRATMRAGPKTQRALSGVLGAPPEPPGEEAPDLAPGRGVKSPALEGGTPTALPSIPVQRPRDLEMASPRPAMDVDWEDNP